jgi:nucleoside-diphosphate-sugar epimerase
MNYLISGMSGFTGTAFANFLRDRGDNVYPIPRSFNIDTLIKYFNYKQPDYFIHLSTYGNHFHQTDFRQMVETNINGTYNILEAAKGFDYKQFFHVSTSSVKFGIPTHYSVTKYCGELLASKYKNVIVSHPYSIYGEGEARHRFIPTVIRCLKTGEQMVLDENATHDWIYVEDCIRAILAGKQEIGRGVAVKNIEVVRILEEIAHKKLNYIPGQLRAYDIDNWFAEEGVEGIYLHEGLKRVYDKFER